MCRIAGLIDFNNTFGLEAEPKVLRMKDYMVHGGPDDSGIYISPDRKVYLANCRLAIIDTSFNGHQPMSSQDGKIWITYNGEIYNFKELRSDLQSLGYRFKSESDTEVLIYGYAEWGIEKLLNRLRGMFAFAIYDARKQNCDHEVILARDRFGIKTLYYHYDKNCFVFASEVKALLKSGVVKDEKNIQSFIRFLQLGSIPYPLTTIKNVFSLDAGNYIVLNNKGILINKYWDVSDCLGRISKNGHKVNSYEDAKAFTGKLFEDSVRNHLISDVPLGVFLSGGIDSSSIVAVASKFCSKPLNTISISFDEKEYDESLYSDIITEKYNTSHNKVQIRYEDFINEQSNIFNAMDQPSIDGINTYFVSKAAKQCGIKVVLSGLGGDEVFLGYKHYLYSRYLQAFLKGLKFIPGSIKRSLFNPLWFSKFVSGSSLDRLSYLSDPTAENIYLLFRGLFTPLQISQLMDIGKNEADYSDNFLATSFNTELINLIDMFDFKYYLKNQLLKDTDFMSMRHAVEIRVPFLDHNLVEKVISFPVNYKINNGVNKPLLVNSLNEKLPSRIINRTKRGFTFPMDIWIKRNSGYFRESSLKCKLLDEKTVNRIWGDFKSRKLHWSRVWALVVLGNFV